MVATNVMAVTELCCAIVPAMVRRGRGRVLNVASIAAFYPVPRSAAYSASKAYVLSFTEALHRELTGTGVTATALCPGPVHTAFADLATGGHGDDLRFPSVMWKSADDVARSAVQAMMDGRRVFTPGWANRLSAVVGGGIPHRLLLPALHRFSK
jgi:short-subunit dehydrogenase